jgi:hypothetical protein
LARVLQWYFTAPVIWRTCKHTRTYLYFMPSRIKYFKIQGYLNVASLLNLRERCHAPSRDWKYKELSLLHKYVEGRAQWTDKSTINYMCQLTSCQFWFFWEPVVEHRQPSDISCGCSQERTAVSFTRSCGPGFETGPGHVGFVVGQSGAGAGFLRILRFPLQSSFAPPITPQSPSCIIRGMYNRPMWLQCWDL